MFKSVLQCSSSFVHILDMYIFLNILSKIVTTSLWVSKFDVKLRCGGVAVWGTCCVRDWLCEGVAVWGSRSVGELWCGRVAVRAMRDEMIWRRHLVFLA